MPRITKAHKKESIITFANDVVKLINEKLNIDNDKNELLNFEYDGWKYYLHKNVHFEIRVWRRNYKHYRGKDQTKGNRIDEGAFVYKEGTNREIFYDTRLGELIHGQDLGFICEGFSFQNYSKTAF